MVFGEIIEPTCRALWDDEYGELPVEEVAELEWQYSTEIPERINKIFVGETAALTALLQKSLLESKKPICKLSDIEACIYKIKDNCFVITYTPQQNVIVGKITEKLIPWLKHAENIYVLTSLPLALFQGATISTDSSSCQIRYLSTKKSFKSYLPLEIPNLVSGLSASIFSYCMHLNLSCTLFVGFFDATPLDSINSEPFTKLLRFLGATETKTCILEENGPSNNLYL